MKDNLRTALRAFVYSASVMGLSLGLVSFIKTGKILHGFALGLLAGIIFGAGASAYLLVMLVLFNRKLFFYNNMPNQLHKHNARNIYYESIAGNATSGRIKYGGLFLTDYSVLFLPHRFAFIRSLTDIPLREIKHVKKTGINLLKWFAGGLRTRLLIETVTDKCYEFSVWDIDVWKKKIDERIKH
jgi:hypothetical protein